MPWKIVKPPDEELVLFVSAALGLVLYWRLWLLVFHVTAPDPALCNEDFLPYYATTFIFALIAGLAVGILFPGKPVLAWAALLLPSFIARYAVCPWSPNNNLLPPILFIDAIATLLVLLPVILGSKNSPRISERKPE
jgi:hypothetical protein